MICSIALTLSSCGSKQDPDEGKVANLPDLPQADVDRLKPIPNTQVLATSLMQRKSPSPVTTAPPPCVADASETDYSVQVSYPITVCRSIATPINALADFYIERQGATSRVATSKLPNFGGVNSPWLICRTDTGPWQGYLIEQHLCTISCATVFSLVFTNAPNPVEFSWDGSLGNHPFDPNFQFLGDPVEVGKIDYGSCHQPPPPHLR
jgi:hypothetical protein